MNALDLDALYDFNIENPRQPWCLPPTLPWGWTEHHGELARETMKTIGAAIELNDMPLPQALHCDRVRTRPLACYGGAMLIELQGYGPEPGLVAFLAHDQGIVELTGDSMPIHAFNRRVSPALSSDQARTDYILLFMNWVHGPEGRFQVLAGDAGFGHRLIHSTDPVIESIESHRIGAITLEEHVDGDKGTTWVFTVPVIYGTGLFNASMRLYSSGAIEMEDDNPEITDIAFTSEVMRGPLLRTLPAKTEDPLQ